MVETINLDYNDTEKSFAVDLSSAIITVSDDDDENKRELSASTSNADDNSLTLSDSNIPSNTYYVDKSSGVIIGPVSHFHGSVTIVQNPGNNLLPLEDAKQLNFINESTKANIELTAPKSAQLVETNKQPEIYNKTKKCSIKKIIAFTFMILAAIGLILFAIFYSLGVYISNENNKPSDNDDMTNTSQIPNSIHKMIYRDRWGGRKPLYERPQKTPVKYVIISHTVGPFCESIATCSAHMVQMQSQHVSDLQSPDIGYNFVIGADDNIYVGRGWDNHNFHMNLDTIGISFTGNYVFNTLKPGMIEACQELLQLGVEKGKLDKDYILVGQNQTYNTISPGPNIYRQIKYWPHFSPDFLEDIKN